MRKREKQMFVIQLDLNHLSQDVFYLFGLLIVLAEFLWFTVDSIIHNLLQHRKEMQELKNEGLSLLIESGRRERKRKKGKKNASSSPSLPDGKDDSLQEPG
jgi:hypothetical protein